MKYRSALDRMKKVEDDRGDPRWIEEMGRDGKPNVFYRYDSNGRLKKYTRKIFGYEITPAEYVRFGDQVKISEERSATEDTEGTELY